MHVLVAGKGMRRGGKGAANIFQVSKLSTGDFWGLEIFLMDLFGDFGREFFEGVIQLIINLLRLCSTPLDFSWHRVLAQ